MTLRCNDPDPEHIHDDDDCGDCPVFVGPAIAQHMLDSRELAEREDDPHVAFHVRSALPLPSSLCATCEREKS